MSQKKDAQTVVRQAGGGSVTATGRSPKTPAVKAVASKRPVANSAAAAPSVAEAVGKSLNKPVSKVEHPATTAAAEKSKKRTTGKDSVKPEANKVKVRKPRLVRDSFTMPELEYQVLTDTKKAFLKAGISVKKSELLRAGIALLQSSELNVLQEVIAKLTPVKAGRPKKEK